MAMMETGILLVLTFMGSCCTGSLSSSLYDAEGAQRAENGEVLYPRYPACRRGREFAIVVHPKELVEGKHYYERVRADGRIKHYLCAPCTFCEDYGLATASPCTRRANTECSAECLVPGCVFDEMSNSCRQSLGSEIETDASSDLESSIDLCSIPWMFNAAERPQSSERKEIGGVEKDSVALTTKETFGDKTTQNNLNDEAVDGESLQKPQQRATEAPQITPQYVFTWTASEALFVGIGIVTAVVVTNAAAILYIRHVKKQNKRRKRAVESPEGFYAVLARARTDSNVTKGNDAVNV